MPHGLAAASGDDAQCPEVGRHPTRRQVGVRQGEVALLAPAGSPGVPDDKPLRSVVITDREHGVTTEHLLVGLWHRCHAGAGHLLALETLVDRESEHEGAAIGQAAAHLVQVLDDSVVGRYPVVERLLVALVRRLLTVPGPRRELPAVGAGGRVIVGPVGLGTDAKRCYALYSVANLSARVELDMTLHGPFVVVNEQARGHEIGKALLLEIELKGRCDGIRSAAAYPALVVNRWAAAAQISARRKRRKRDRRSGVKKVPRVRQVRLPSVPSCLAYHDLLVRCWHSPSPLIPATCPRPGAGHGSPPRST